MKRSRNYSEIATISIAIFALIVSVWEGIETRQFYRLSVKPHLDIVRSYSGIGEKGLSIENNGLGPAIIKKINIKNSSTIFDLTNVKDINNLLKSLNLDSAKITALRDGYLLKKETKEDIITIKTDDYRRKQDTLILKRFWNFIRNCEVFLCYESIYGDEFNSCSPYSACNK